MKPTVLIAQELGENATKFFDGYIACCTILGYEYAVCHDIEQLPKVMKAFEPNIVFWNTQDYTNRVAVGIDTMRLHSKNLKVVLAYSFGIEMYLVGERQADVYLPHRHIFPNQFQKIITEHFFTNLYDEPSPDKWANKLDVLPELTDHALRAIAAEQPWSGKQSYLEQLLEWKNRGDQLTESEQRSLAELIKMEELLMQRKEKAAEILIDRGFTGTSDELMTPKRN